MVVKAIHTFCVPDKVPATGAAVTVTVLVAVASGQPPVPVTVYVIVAVPEAIPEIAPVEALTVAIAAFEVDQVPPVCVEENDEFPPTQIACVPESVPADGAAVIVTDVVVVKPKHPPVFGGKV